VSAYTVALLHQAQLGDRDAFAELYRAFHGPVTAYVTVRMRDRDRDAVPDLVQEAFCDALAQLHTALPDVRGWFIILAAKACIRHDWSRRRYTRAAYAVHDEATRTDRSLASAATPTRLGRLTFAHALARLTPDQRRAFQLRYIDEYPRDAAARLMHRSIAAVRWLEWKALQRLQVSLQPSDVLAAETATSR
jgi:RNA polymerase sigma-70 factor (ECF subfamily)